MHRVVMAAAFCAIGLSCHAQEVATCRSPSGRAFYHSQGAVGKAQAGWTDDKISGGVFTLRRSGDDLDLLYVDATAKPMSTIQDGGLVRLLRHGPDSAAVLVHYPNGPTTEIYTFFRDRAGVNRFTLSQSKSGERALAPKSSLLAGTCDQINFEVLE